MLVKLTHQNETALGNIDMTTITITGYEQDTKCEHCGRKLVHGIIISDGRVVGATCLDKKLTKAKIYHGKKYRLGAELIVKVAKVVQWKQPKDWLTYGVSQATITFESAE